MYCGALMEQPGLLSRKGEPSGWHHCFLEVCPFHFYGICNYQKSASACTFGKITQPQEDGRCDRNLYVTSNSFEREASGEIEHLEFSSTPCPFLRYDKEKAICKIYPVRPWICEGYPGPGISCRGGLERL
jgi:Fe-S-cluster containining protein